MWFVFLNYRFKLIFHLETSGHLFLALLQIFLPFPQLLEQSASQASYVVTPEMKQLRKMSWATAKYSCHPKDLKYRLLQLPEDHGLQASGYFWALVTNPRQCSKTASNKPVAILPLGPPNNTEKCTKPDISPYRSLLPGLAQKRIIRARRTRRSKREIRSHVQL